MAIPQPHDRRLAELQDLAGSIMIALTALRYADPKRRDGRVVRERLQDYCDAVMETANAILSE